MALAEQQRRGWQFWKRPAPLAQTPPQTPENLAGTVIDSIQRATRDWLQEQKAEQEKRNFRTEAQKFQDAAQIWVTNGVEYRPAPLFEQVKQLTLTTDGQEDMLTVHAHLAAMDMIRKVREGTSPDVARSELQDTINVFREVRENPAAPQYIAHKGMVRALTENRLDKMLTQRLLQEAELFGALRTIATRGREYDYTL